MYSTFSRGFPAGTRLSILYIYIFPLSAASLFPEEKKSLNGIFRMGYLKGPGERREVSTRCIHQSSLVRSLSSPDVKFSERDFSSSAAALIRGPNADSPLLKYTDA